MALIHDPDLPLASLFPLRSLIVTLQLTRKTNLRIFHQPALSAFLRFLAGSADDFDLHIRIDVPESGRIAYQAGDYYRFMLIGLGSDTRLLQTLFSRLKALPTSSPKTGKQLAFCDNLRFISFHDALSEQVLNQLDEVSTYAFDTLCEEVELWRYQHLLEWHFLSPARLLKDKQRRENLKGEARFIRDAPDINGAGLLQRIHNSLADLLRRREGISTRAALPPDFPLLNVHLFWMDCEYTDAKGKDKLMGGVSGRIHLQLPSDLSPAWWQLLILGQYIGIGQRASFGWGRYQLQTAEGEFSYRNPIAANSLLMLAQDEDNLHSAWRHVMSGRDDLQSYNEDELRQNEDGEEVFELPETPLQQLKQDFNKLLEGDYKTPDLRGYLIPKSNGGVRPLAVPPVYDRILQRAISQVISPALDSLMYRHSHGFRRGRSRLTARYDIQAAWRAGYRWVYESDIKDFFDSVNLQALQDRLNALFYGDPLVRCIIQWMKADVVFQGKRIERHNGLPQGSPLSPLMANLMLDDFDSDMQQAGFFIIRFADDFIVLCKNPEQAQLAGQAAQKSLQEHGLDLHPDKTRISAMDEGFKYLGYLFMNDMALDIGGKKSANLEQVSTAPPNSWLAKLGEQQPQKISKEQTLQDILKRLSCQQPLKIGERSNTGTLLNITGSHSVLSTLNKQLNVHRNDKRLFRIPWKSLQTIVLFGHHQITTQAMQAALRSNVNIHLATASGWYQGVITHNRNSQHQNLWLQQTSTFSEEDKALYIARALVGSRLRHMKKHLYQRRQAYRSRVLDNAIGKASTAGNLDSLRGYEGSATREYFQRLALVIPDEYEFSGRNRRPPTDPYNVLLSLGYTLLYAYSESFIHAAGLLPWQGAYHQARGKHAALASDLMEPFRHLVERTALSLLNRQDISPDDFSFSPAGRCNINNQARRKYIALLLQRLDSKIKARGALEAETWLSHMQHQVNSLRGFIQNGDAFEVFRLN